MVEASSPDPYKYYDCSDFPFNFDFLGFDHLPVQASEVQNKINTWLWNTPLRHKANWLVNVFF